MGDILDMQKSLENTLKKQGYKITRQRKVILKIILENRNNLLNIQQIFERAKTTCPDIEFSTIYRNIELLEEKGIIHKINTGKPQGSYKLKELESHHHHIICKGCGQTEAIEFCPFDYIGDCLREKSFHPTSHNFEVFGYCKKCTLGKSGKYIK